MGDEQWFSEMSVEYLAFCCFCFVFSALSSVFGFGAGLFVLIVGSYVLPERDVVALSRRSAVNTTNAHAGPPCPPCARFRRREREPTA